MMQIENFGSFKTFDDLFDHLIYISKEIQNSGVISIGIEDNLLWMWVKQYKIIIPLLERLKLGRDQLYFGDWDKNSHEKLKRKIQKIFQLEAIYQIGKIILTLEDNEEIPLCIYFNRMLNRRKDPSYKPTFDLMVDKLKMFQPPLQIDGSEKFLEYKLNEFFHLMLEVEEEEYTNFIDKIVHFINNMKITEEASNAGLIKSFLTTIKEILELKEAKNVRLVKDDQIIVKKGIFNT